MCVCVCVCVREREREREREERERERRMTGKTGRKKCAETESSTVRRPMDMEIARDARRVKSRVAPPESYYQRRK